jgi:hypothetical protein
MRIQEICIQYLLESSQRGACDRSTSTFRLKKYRLLRECCLVLEFILFALFSLWMTASFFFALLVNLLLWCWDSLSDVGYVLCLRRLSCITFQISTCISYFTSLLLTGNDKDSCICWTYAIINLQWSILAPTDGPMRVVSSSSLLQMTDTDALPERCV